MIQHSEKNGKIRLKSEEFKLAKYNKPMYTVNNKRAGRRRRNGKKEHARSD
jgi:hypothetical protein